ncbi:hypothetical protein [Paenibacillus validus]|uniref:Uncharacterized protein n=1 Tax=Paenibacillus validus TaxID=44253 RepID=A0A7X2Z7X8_9BACL|nr:hypothetical protein [Paenibacillus validus]MUG69395.1 hypothetical protein [Paenibacillus validus]
MMKAIILSFYNIAGKHNVFGIPVHKRLYIVNGQIQKTAARFLGSPGNMRRDDTIFGLQQRIRILSV